MEFIVDTLKWLFRTCLLLVVLFFAQQFLACNTKIPGIEKTIVSGIICNAPGDADRAIPANPKDLDYRPLILGQIKKIGKLASTTKKVTDTTYTLPNDQREAWIQLLEGDESWWDSLKKSLLNPGILWDNLVSGREVKVRATGTIFGAVDIEKLQENDIDTELGLIQVYTVRTSPSTILTVDVLPESIEVLSDDRNPIDGLMAKLFEKDDEFKQRTIALTKEMILKDGCNEEFMQTTADTAKSTLESLLSEVDGPNRVVVEVPTGQCVLPQDK